MDYDMRREALTFAQRQFPTNNLVDLLAAAASIASFLAGEESPNAPAETKKGRRSAGGAGKSSADSPPAASQSDAGAAEPEATEAEEEVDIGPVTSDEVDKELLAPVEPAPETSKQLVDAGTGKPATTTVQMTMEDVKVAAAKLAAKDTPKLVALLKEVGAANLSGVPKAKLPDFVEKVMAALEGDPLA